MWGRKKEEPEHIQPSSMPHDARGSYLFEKTKPYTLTGNQVITVPGGYTATVYFKFYDPITISACTQKDLMKAAKIRGDKLGKQFYIIFRKTARIPQQTWAVGSHSVKRNGFSFLVGANGNLELTVKDVNKYISTIGADEETIYSNESVIEHGISLLCQKAEEIIADLFEEVDAFITDGNFLTEEYMIRLNNAIQQDDPFSQFGIEFPSIQVRSVRVRNLDVQSARNYFIELAKAEAKRREEARERARAAAELSEKTEKSEKTDNTTAKTDTAPTASPAVNTEKPMSVVAVTESEETATKRKKTVTPTDGVKKIIKTRPAGDVTSPTAEEPKKIIRKKPITPAEGESVTAAPLKKKVPQQPDTK